MAVNLGEQLQVCNSIHGDPSLSRSRILPVSFFLNNFYTWGVFRATGQIQTLDRCNEDTTSVRWTHTQPTKLLGEPRNLSALCNKLSWAV